MNGLGFKQITGANWLETDPVCSVLVRLDGARAVPTSGDDWLRRILEPSLAEAVPTEVRGLYETARGALAYGYFFYPLYTLGVEQLWRVGDAAIQHKCEQLGFTARGHAARLSKRIEWLEQRGVLTAHAAARWHALRNLRNWASHASRQAIVGGPADAIATLQRLAEDVNAIFAGEGPLSPAAGA